MRRGRRQNSSDRLCGSLLLLYRNRYYVTIAEQSGRNDVRAAMLFHKEYGQFHILCQLQPAVHESCIDEWIGVEIKAMTRASPFHGMVQTATFPCIAYATTFSTPGIGVFPYSLPRLWNIGSFRCQWIRVLAHRELLKPRLTRPPDS